MMIDLSEYVGQVRNDTGIFGKAFIFKVIRVEPEHYTFECMLFVHPTEPSFLTLSDDDISFDKDEIIAAIFNKYPHEKLLSA